MVLLIWNNDLFSLLLLLLATKFCFTLRNSGCVPPTRTANWEHKTKWARQGKLRLLQRNPVLLPMSENENECISKSSINGGSDCISESTAKDTEKVSRASFHHYAIKTKNILAAMSFYNLLGFEESLKFKTGAARAVWLQGLGTRLELIEVPDFMNPAPRAVDLSHPSEAATLGLNHIALDVTEAATKHEGVGGMADFLKTLNRLSEERFKKSIRTVIKPYKQMIGPEVFEVAFIADADGTLIELLCHLKTLDHEMLPDW